MEFLKIKTSRLTNNEHFELNTEVKSVIEKTTPAGLGIEAKYPVYLLSYQNEDEAINVIRTIRLRKRKKMTIVFATMFLRLARYD